MGVFDVSGGPSDPAAVCVKVESETAGWTATLRTAADADQFRGLAATGYTLLSPITKANAALWREVEPVIRECLNCVDSAEPTKRRPFQGFSFGQKPDGTPVLTVAGLEHLPGILVRGIGFSVDVGDLVPTLTLDVVTTMYNILVDKYRLVVREAPPGASPRQFVMDDPGYVFTTQPVSEEEYRAAVESCRRKSDPPPAGG